MNILDKDENENMDQFIMRKIKYLSKNKQGRIESALQKVKVNDSQRIKKSFEDPQITAHKVDILANLHKKPFSIKEGENIQKILNDYQKVFNDNHDSYLEHKKENDKFCKKYQDGKNLHSSEKNENKQDNILDHLLTKYDKRGYKIDKIKKVESIFKQSPLLLNERGILRYYKESKDKRDEMQDKDYKYSLKLKDHINKALQKESINVEEESVRNDYLLNYKNNRVNKSFDVYEGIPTNKIYKQVVLNELNNYELRESIKELITEETETDNAYYELKTRTKETKKSLYQINNNSHLPYMNNTKEIETISIRENLEMDTLASIFKTDKDSNNNAQVNIKSNNNNSNNNYLPGVRKINNLSNLNISKFSRQNTETNILSQANNRNEKTENKHIQFRRGKSILAKSGETISNWDANNTKRTEFTTFNNDNKSFRQSGFLINSDFIKKDDTKYIMATKKYNELESFYDRVSKKDFLAEEIINYFNENPKKGYILDENKKSDPSEILKSIKDTKKIIEMNNIDEKIGGIIDRVANYSIDPEDLIKVKELDDKFSTYEISLVKYLHRMKN